MKQPETRLRQLANGYWIAEAKTFFGWRGIAIVIDKSTGRPAFHLLCAPDSQHWSSAIMITMDLAERNRLHFLALKGF